MVFFYLANPIRSFVYRKWLGAELLPRMRSE
jgi:hypothetical protein